MAEREGLSKAEPAPKPNDSTPVWNLVIQDIVHRDKAGREKYGVPLQAFNGRDQLVDLYQELLDAVVYIRTAIEERKLLQNQASRMVDAMVTGADDPVSERFRILREVRTKLFQAGL